MRFPTMLNILKCFKGLQTTIMKVTLSKNATEACIAEMSDEDTISLPLSVTRLEIKESHIKNLYIPRHITWVMCYNNGIEELDLGFNLKHLYCGYNCIKAFHIQKKLETLDISNNILKTLTIDPANQFLSSLDIRGNQVEDFDALLPDSMRTFHCARNPGIRIKYLDFAFTVPGCFSDDLCEGDFWHVLDPDFKTYDETRLYWVWEKVNYGDTYIDVKALPTHDNMFVVDEDRERSI
jgi:Leucine-rich repeat (LRR) protein